MKTRTGNCQEIFLTTALLRIAFAAIACISFWSSLSTSRAGPLDVWHVRSSGVTNALNADAYGNGTFVVVGNEGTLLTSSDGVAWTRRNSGAASALNSVVFANNIFVIVGESGSILTSANGASWIRRNSGTTDFLYDVTYGGGKFIAVSDTGTVVSSTDGLTWTPRSGSTTGVYGVAFGNSKYVSVGATVSCFIFCVYNTVTYASGDAVTWSQTYPGQGYLMSDLAFGNGSFVAVGDQGTILTSTDGTSWIQPNSGASEFLWNVAFGNNTFVVVGGQRGGIFTSSDRVNWTARNSGTPNGLFNVAYANGTFMAVGQYGTILQSDSVVVAPPTLLMSLSGNNFQFSWPVSAGSFSLEETDNLTTPTWSSTPNQIPTVVGDQTVVTLPAAQTGTRFYRLVR